MFTLLYVGFVALEPCVREPHIYIIGYRSPGQRRMPGTPMVGTGGPGDAGDGLRARRHQLFGRPAGIPDFTSPISSIFDGFWGSVFMFF